MIDDGFVIRAGGLEAPEVVALLDVHVRLARGASPPCSAHALDLDGLRAPGISFFSGWLDGQVASVGALKRLSEQEGEIKSMHTSEHFRGRGCGARMLDHLLAAAGAQGLRRVSLETGVQDYFRPAVRLYQRRGFEDCPPFADYRVDPNSRYMTLRFGN